MKTLSGHVKCTNPSATINPESVISVEIRDVSRMDVASSKVAGTELTGKTAFPLEFRLTYDEAPMFNNPSNTYAVKAEIHTHGKLDFISDTHCSLISDHGDFLDHVDVYVTPVNN